jgi:DNA repair protein RadC
MEGKLHEGHRQRLKEKYLSNGLEHFSDHEVIELLLFYAIPRKNTNEIAINMINEYGSLAGLCEADPRDICNNCEVSENTAILISLVSSLSGRYIGDKENKYNDETLSKPEYAGEYAIKLFYGKHYEHFYLICLNSQNKINHAAVVQKGTLNEVPVYTRIIVELALRHKAHSVILTHNHPGGSLVPSQDDINITNAVKAALDTINIKVNDHIIVAGNKYISLKQHNYF